MENAPPAAAQSPKDLPRAVKSGSPEKTFQKAPTARPCWNCGRPKKFTPLLAKDETDWPPLHRERAVADWFRGSSMVPVLARLVLVWRRPETVLLPRPPSKAAPQTEGAGGRPLGVGAPVTGGGRLSRLSRLRFFFLPGPVARSLGMKQEHRPAASFPAQGAGGWWGSGGGVLCGRSRPIVQAAPVYPGLPR